MREKYREEHETCNATCAPPSSWTWYEKLHNILGGTPKMTNAVGGIDQGSHLPHPQMVNLDDHFNYILKNNHLKALNVKPQFLLIVMIMSHQITHLTKHLI
jgi:hypothetical protein